MKEERQKILDKIDVMIKDAKATRKSAIQKIEHHERICRYMQKQTFERIDRMEARIARMEKFIICGLGAILLAVLSNHM